jgi:uncharacterized protein YodC (DUF2158 family)
MDDFQIGDVVQLKSGGTLLTIEEIKENKAKCTYFDKQDNFNCQFIDIRMLKIININK